MASKCRTSNVDENRFQKMSFLYPRTVTIKRTVSEAVWNGVQEVGDVGYADATQDDVEVDADGEQILYKNICCSIQAEQSGRTKDGLLPSDATTKPMWKILIQPRALPIYSIRDRDIVVDDEGYRHIVTQNYWTGIGYELSVVRLEA
jgi:hypothetical protein